MRVSGVLVTDTDKIHHKNFINITVRQTTINSIQSSQSIDAVWVAALNDTMGQERKEERPFVKMRRNGQHLMHHDYGTLVDKDLLFYLNIKKHSVSSQTDGNPDEPNEPSSVGWVDGSIPSSNSDFGDSIRILGLPHPSDLPDDRNLQIWNMNYHEASIYLQVLNSFRNWMTSSPNLLAVWSEILFRRDSTTISLTVIPRIVKLCPTIW